MTDRESLDDFDIEGKAKVRLRSPTRVVFEWVRSAVGFVALAVVVLSVSGWLRAPDLPEQAPAFALRDLDGESVRLADLRGRTVVLNFWATWCGPCRLEAPTFAAFAQAHPELTVLGIVADGPPGKVRAVAAELGVTYPVALGDAATFAAYGVETYPTTVVVGPDGEVRAAHTGLMLRPQLAWAAGVWW